MYKTPSIYLYIRHRTLVAQWSFSNALSNPGPVIVSCSGHPDPVNYIPSPYRYTLTMSDTVVLGQRRAAQRVAAAVSNEIADGASDADVSAAVKANSTKMAGDIP